MESRDMSDFFYLQQRVLRSQIFLNKGKGIGRQVILDLKTIINFLVCLSTRITSLMILPIYVLIYIVSDRDS